MVAFGHAHHAGRVTPGQPMPSLTYNQGKCMRRLETPRGRGHVWGDVEDYLRAVEAVLATAADSPRTR